jgi:hypothetical protein
MAAQVPAQRRCVWDNRKKIAPARRRWDNIDPYALPIAWFMMVVLSHRHGDSLGDELDAQQSVMAYLSAYNDHLSILGAPAIAYWRAGAYV